MSRRDLAGLVVIIALIVGAMSLDAHWQKTESEGDATPLVAVGSDDPTTSVNESSRLDTTRISAVGDETMGPTELAEAFAYQNGLTSCGPVADSELSDVVLTIVVNPLTREPVTDQIVAVSWDDAWDNHNGSRNNLLACAGGEHLIEGE